MFEQGGELAIFRRVGLNTVFFSRDVVGAGLPSLTYMLVFADAAAREKNWDVFRQDPEWLKLRAHPGYADAESSPASRRRSSGRRRARRSDPVIPRSFARRARELAGSPALSLRIPRTRPARGPSEWTARGRLSSRPRLLALQLPDLDVPE